MINSDRVEGTLELLAAAGVDLRWGTQSLRGLIRTASDGTQPFQLTPGDDEAVILSILRSAFSGRPPGVGDTFRTSDDEVEYRVLRLARDPGTGLIRFTCSVTHLMPDESPESVIVLAVGGGATLTVAPGQVLRIA